MEWNNRLEGILKDSEFRVYKEIRSRYIYFKRKNRYAEPRGCGYNWNKLGNKLGLSSGYIGSLLKNLEKKGLIKSYMSSKFYNGSYNKFTSYKPMYDLEYEPHLEEFIGVHEEALRKEKVAEDIENRFESIKYSLTPKNWGYVYVIEDEFGRIKIGLSENPKRRIANIRSGAGIELKNQYITKPLTSCSTVEAKGHEAFDSYRTIGEWFRGIEFEEVVSKIEEIVKDDKGETEHLKAKIEFEELKQYAKENNMEIELVNAPFSYRLNIRY